MGLSEALGTAAHQGDNWAAAHMPSDPQQHTQMTCEGHMTWPWWGAELHLCPSHPDQSHDLADHSSLWRAGSQHHNHATPAWTRPGLGCWRGCADAQSYRIPGLSGDQAPQYIRSRQGHCQVHAQVHTWRVAQHAHNACTYTRYRCSHPRHTCKRTCMTHVINT